MLRCAFLILSVLAVSGRASSAQCQADFEATPTTGPAALEVQFTDLSTGLVDTWSWDFGDGSSARVASPRHTYDQPGSYTVSLTVSGPCGSETVTRTNLITVDPLPPGFIDELLTTTPTTATGFRVLGSSDLVIWRKAGIVTRWSDGVWGATLADISEEVANWNDHGLHGFCFDPDYASNGHVYLYYAVDRHHLDHFGTPSYDPQASSLGVETIARITRYTVFDPGDRFTTIDPRTRVVLVGQDITNGIPICATSHGVGWIEFGHDGSLLFSAGDASLGSSFQSECLAAGIFRPEEDVDSFRAQLLDGANGKIHRIDPTTGHGMDDNPFYDAARPDSWRSRVWALGLRNPYSFAIRPETQEVHGDGPGKLYVGDVGNIMWEELSVVTEGGQNLGWPLYEGVLEFPAFFFQNRENLDAPNPLFPAGGCGEYLLFEELLVNDSLNRPSWPNPCDPAQQITSIPTYVHRRPVLTWGHREENFSPVTYVPDYDAMGNAIAVEIGDVGSPVGGLAFYGNASMGGTFFTGTTFPLQYRDVYFHTDFGEGWIKALSFDENDVLLDVHEFGAGLGNPTRLATDPDQTALYYLRFGGGTQIRKISYGGNAPPLAQVTATPDHGPSPLRVELSASGSSDPEGTSLLFDWDFGDGSPWTPLAALGDTAHVYPSVDVTAEAVEVLAPAGPAFVHVDPVPSAMEATVGGGLPWLKPMLDDLYAPPGSLDGSAQVVVERPGLGIGYRFASERVLVGLVFQEGLDTGSQGGWLAVPTVDVPVDGSWVPVNGFEVHPSYPGDAQVGFETFLLTFDAVATGAVRLRDGAALSGPGRFTVGELRALALPDPAPSGPSSFVAGLTVTDEGGLTGSTTALVSPDNTPPVISIASPFAGQTYPVGVPTQVALEAVLEDAEHDPASLSCEWQIDLVHGSHTHPEPPLLECSSSFTLLPHGELEGQPIHWRFELLVTDPAGLTASAVTTMLPEGDCNLNGIDDALDIASGEEKDRNGNGIPDSCEWGLIRNVPSRPVPR